MDFLARAFLMIQAASMDQRSFRKLLSRNIGVGLLGAVAFVAVINYLALGHAMGRTPTGSLAMPTKR